MNNSELVTLSYGRCLAQGNVLFDRFYDHFFNSSPQIAKMFQKTDMAKQKNLLRAGINYAIMYSTENGHNAAEGVLSRIRTSHAQERLDVSPSLYPLWISTLIRTIGETDPKFSPTVKTAWTEVLGHAVQYIASGYKDK